jgi:general secretion pathway protein G
MTFKNSNRERGFTLIEIMVVIIILGILASYVAVKLTGQTEEARRTQARVQIETFRTALDLYRLDNGSYPTTEQGLQALVSSPTVGKLPRKWREGGYIAKIPKDPWKNEYSYLSPGENGDFDIISYGDDNEPGGEGKDADVNSWEDEQK